MTTMMTKGAKLTASQIGGNRLEGRALMAKAMRLMAQARKINNKSLLAQAERMMAQAKKLME